MKRIALRKLFLGITMISFVLSATAQENFEGRRFEQMDQMLPTPNVYRTASGAPGHAYWQQQADYVISVELDDENQRITGSEWITYTNNSPEALTYLWVQLDQNVRREDADTYTTKETGIKDYMSEENVRDIIGHGFDLGYNIIDVSDAGGNKLAHQINKTMMRVSPMSPVKPGQQYKFKIDWNFNINDRTKVSGRSGYEYFEKDGNYLYHIAQWFPRMAVYDDVNGWQNKQFLGRGEFALPFGNYEVKITVPADHVVASTGSLQNPTEVLSQTELTRLEMAKTASEKVEIITQEEVIAREKQPVKNKSTWIFKADNVRDFAFATSRKFIWDAKGVMVNGKQVMAMSYYPKEAMPLFGTYSTKAIEHALKFYGEYTGLGYPYPVANSVNWESGGMEYPMISFNYGRPREDGTYSEYKKYGTISVIIHEVGHNYFPMIVNSDERQWTWMDEGINSFVQYLAEQAWDSNYPSRRGPAKKIVPYMKGGKNTMVPIMTNSEQLKQFGNNGYGKPATALNILRTSVMGEELFDYAFKEYCQRWAFKHPSPADFFRTMEDASAVDLDWFWKGWFYTTDNVDVEVADVTWYKVEDQIDAETNKKDKKKRKSEEGSTTATLSDTQTDKLNTPVPLEMTVGGGDELMHPDQNYYEIKLENQGGLVMPVVLKLNYRDGSSEIKRLPAEIWRYNERVITKTFVTEKELLSVEYDPYEELADVNSENNFFPRKQEEDKFDQFKNGN